MVGTMVMWLQNTEKFLVPSLSACRMVNAVDGMVVSNPMPKNTEAVLKRFKKIIVPELNTGQLGWLLRAKYLAPAEGLNKVQGKPFLVSEIEAAIDKALS